MFIGCKVKKKKTKHLRHFVQRKNYFKGINNGNFHRDEEEVKDSVWFLEGILLKSIQ